MDAKSTEDINKILGKVSPEKLAKLMELTKGSSTPGTNDIQTIMKILTSKTPKTLPNEKCPCGSGKKYKKCCFTK